MECRSQSYRALEEVAYLGSSVYRNLFPLFQNAKAFDDLALVNLRLRSAPFIRAALVFLERRAALRLLNPMAIAEYLTEAFEKSDFAGILEAIKSVMQAQNVKELAEVTGMRRDGLYKTFARKKDPQLSRVLSLFEGMDVRIVVKPGEKEAATAQTRSPTFEKAAPRLTVGSARSLLVQSSLTLHSPLKCADTIFAINDLGRGDDLNSDLLNKGLKVAPFPILSFAATPHRAAPAQAARPSAPHELSRNRWPACS